MYYSSGICRVCNIEISLREGWNFWCIMDWSIFRFRLRMKWLDIGWENFRPHARELLIDLLRIDSCMVIPRLWNVLYFCVLLIWISMQTGWRLFLFSRTENRDSHSLSPEQTIYNYIDQPDNTIWRQRCGTGTSNIIYLFYNPWENIQNTENTWRQRKVLEWKPLDGNLYQSRRLYEAGLKAEVKESVCIYSVQED